MLGNIYIYMYIQSSQLRVKSLDQRTDQRVQMIKFSKIYSDVHQCTFRCILRKLFLWSLWSTFRCTLGMGNKPGIHGLCIPVDTFDLRCKSIMYVCTCMYVRMYICMHLEFNLAEFLNYLVTYYCVVGYFWSFLFLDILKRPSSAKINSWAHPFFENILPQLIIKC